MASKVVHSLFLLCSLVRISTSSPNITSFDKIAYITEGTTATVDLSKINCDDTDGDPTHTYVKSVSPSSPCTGCFNVYTCGALECLQYRAGVGTLDRTLAPSYTIVVSCTDNNEAPALETIEVVVVPNSPPVFSPNTLTATLTKASTLAVNSVLTTVSATDLDNDTVIYTMKVTPSSAAAHYTIDQYTGKIINTIPLKSECETDDVSFAVTASDGHHTAGPMIIDMQITNPNFAPMATNLQNTLIQVPENSPITQNLFAIYGKDDNSGTTITYNMTSSNTAGIAQYSILKTCSPTYPACFYPAKALDYEDSSLRYTDAVVQLSDGNCYSPPYKVKFEVTDVNEQPMLNLTTSTYEICEGLQEFNPAYIVTDPDNYDTQKWSLPTNLPTSNPFAIDQNTGALRTMWDYDVDVTTNPKVFTLPVTVTDKGGLSSSVTVTVSVIDCNDNAPIFQKNVYTSSSTECASPGSKLTSILATDADTATRGNKDIYYDGSGGSVYVNDKGDVILNEPLPAGTVVTFNAYAHDRGQIPGPLTSANPAVISINFLPCPTTAPPVVAPTAAPATTVAPVATAASSSSKKSDDNLVWIILAALLGTLFLGLLGFLLWRYGGRCLDAFSNLNCEKQCCKTRPHRLLTPRAERRPPVPKAPEEPVEKEPDPVGPGFIFGFWKERYPDDDFKHMPDRKRLPSPGDMNTHYPHTIDPVDDPLTSQAPAAGDAPKKNCIVM